jgi:glucan phosphoethanolaminetransferase (alkaline phosphatase superfamily)
MMGISLAGVPRRLVGGVVAAWAALVLVPDLYARWVDPQSDMSWKMKLTYTAVMASSCALWIFVGLAVAWLRRRSSALAWALIVVFGVAAAGGALLATAYQIYFGYTPKPVIVAFLLHNLHYLTPLLASGLGTLRCVGLVAAPLALVAWLGFLTRDTSRPAAPRAAFAVTGALALFVPVVNGALPGKLSSLPPDYLAVRAASLGTSLWIRDVDLPMLPMPRRATLAPSHADQAPNVVLLINESVGARQVPPWTPVPSDHPMAGSRLAAALAAAGERAVWFPRAVTVAPATNVAIPAMLTGLDPQAPSDSFRRAPLLWHEARAAGLQTALVSAQDFKYSMFREFFLGEGAPDTALTAAEIGPPTTVDSGVDDARAATAAITFLKAADKTRPFLLVVQFSGTHFPCWAPSQAGEELTGVFDDRRREARCRFATAHIDAQVGRILDALVETGAAASTAVISTSDHGDSFDPKRPRRPENFFDETLTVPLGVILPERWTAQHPEALAQLKSNRALRVSNLDIVPTVLELLGRWPRPDGDPRPPLAGLSLVGRMPPDRIFVAASRSSLYEAPADHFSIYRGQRKWVFDERAGLRLYDLDADPREQTDLAPAADASDRQTLAQALERNPRLRTALASNAAAVAYVKRSATGP